MSNFPGYTILRPLGQGGMATVYLALQQSLGREVALKILSPALSQHKTATERFLREAHIAANLHHPNIVEIHDVAIHEGTPYIAMEYVACGSVAPKSGVANDANAALRIVRDIAAALDYAHRQGVIHRDIKPENILREADGSHVLSDFGIARTIESTTALTDEGDTIGTPHYMSPEHLSGEKVDGRSDLYSLGVVLYQLLSGELPYTGTDGWAIGMQHLSAPIPTLPASFRHLQTLVDGLLAKQPGSRPQTGGDVVRQIDALLAAGTATPTMPLPVAPAMASTPAPAMTSRRRPWLIAASLPRVAVGGIVLAILIVLLVAGGGLLWPTANAPHAALGLTSAANVAERSIAVLPFVNMSGDPKNEYFSDGLAETTLDMLAQVPDLKVIARTSSFAFKGKPQDVRQIGAALGAANLLEGSVQQAGDTLRITVQLIKVADGTHLWSHQYDRPMGDVFNIQDEIASQVVQELAIALPAKEQKRLTQTRTENVTAYQEYLKGIALMPGRKVADMRVAAQHFERSIVLDPNYARAYAAASDAYMLLDAYGTITAAERVRIDADIDRALALAPDLGEAHISRASRLEDKGDLPGAEREYRRGIALAPSYARGYGWYGRFLTINYGRVDEAQTMFRRAAALDPLSPGPQNNLITFFIGNGRLTEAETLIAKLHADHPEFALAYRLDSLLANMQGDLVRSLRATHQLEALDPGAVSGALDGCYIRLRFGALDDARRCSDALASRALGSPDIQNFSAELKRSSGDWAGALTQLELIPDPDQGALAQVLIRLGRYDEALTTYRRMYPELLVTPDGKLYPRQVDAATEAGIVLLHTGAQARGQALLRHALQVFAKRPRIMDGDQWTDVEIHVYLGEHEQAIAALKKGVADGYFLDLALMDNDPLLADFRKDARYQKVLAPARAKAAAQIAAARTAGL